MEGAGAAFDISEDGGGDVREAEELGSFVGCYFGEGVGVVALGEGFEDSFETAFEGDEVDIALEGDLVVEVGEVAVHGDDVFDGGIGELPEDGGVVEGGLGVELECQDQRKGKCGQEFHFEKVKY